MLSDDCLEPFKAGVVYEFSKCVTLTNQNVENCSTIVISEASEAVYAPIDLPLLNLLRLVTIVTDRRVEDGFWLLCEWGAYESSMRGAFLPHYQDTHTEGWLWSQVAQCLLSLTD